MVPNVAPHGKEARMASLRQDPSHRLGRSAPSRPEGQEPARGGSLSVVVPAKNEAAGLPQLVAEVAAALRPLVARCDGGHRLVGFEVVVVDDGSPDATPEVLRLLATESPELRPIALSRNVGQSSATAAGLRAAAGDWVATLDADLQNDPADLAALWDALPGYDAAL